MQERELLTFVIGFGVLIYACLQYRKSEFLGRMLWPFIGYGMLVIAWFCNLLDNQYAFALLRVFEHFFYAVAACCFLFWLRKEAEPDQ